ncbi:hypothetical protein DQ04_14091000 [Trypanosoma grayi]|uniref:hypothetical protein n=1 Tax=Trypanosoma grayi TaxID=71804 RepID=UPI0004F443AD|nr:hypothetical protein DQ04_14091000 [Trypanosoma grayi]KEG06402.1 hypothetical protein DQ04_14091000 [Trypanosoma grayi]
MLVRRVRLLGNHAKGHHPIVHESKCMRNLVRSDSNGEPHVRNVARGEVHDASNRTPILFRPQYSTGKCEYTFWASRDVQHHVSINTLCMVFRRHGKVFAHSIIFLELGYNKRTGQRLHEETVCVEFNSRGKDLVDEVGLAFRSKNV